MLNDRLTIGLLATMVATACAGDLKLDYFGATKPGSWAEYAFSAADGTKTTSTSQRNADDDGRVVVAETVKVTAGVGVGTESENIYVLPKDFNLGRDWLSYGKFTEKMTMKYGTMVMPVAAPTLEAIKKGAKDYRGEVTFEAAEQVAGHKCDRYAYSVVIAGPVPARETGQLWLDPTVPFGVVKQVAKSSGASSYEIQLQATGQTQLNPVAEAPAAEPAPAVPAAPTVVTLLEGYEAGRVGIGVTVEKDSNGRHLQLTFINKTEAALTVKIPAGALVIPASDPIGALKIVVKAPSDMVLPAGESSAAITVDQQPGRGAFEGVFQLSVYDGTRLFSGSVTKGTVTK